MSDSLSMTQVVDAVLRRDGIFFVMKFPAHIAEAIAWGIYLLLASYAIHLLRRKGLRDSRPRQILLATTIVMFLLSTILLILKICGLAAQMRRVYFTPTKEGETQSDKFDGAQIEFYKIEIFAELLFSLEVLFGDAVVLWRTWVIWSDSRKPMILPIVIWIGSLGTWFAWVIYSAVVARTPLGLSAAIGTKLKLANFGLSVAANFVATAMIGFRAWQHRRLLRKNLGSSAKVSQVEKILSLLVESGSVYIILWIIQIILLNVVTGKFGPLIVSVNVFGQMSNQIVGIYPTIIIVLVELRRTIWDGDQNHGAATPPPQPAHSRTQLSTVQFAPGVRPTASRDSIVRSVFSDDDETLEGSHTEREKKTKSPSHF